MTSIQVLRAVVDERLSAAAEEIFQALRRTIEGYEEELQHSKREIGRQRRLLQSLLPPEVKPETPAGVSFKRPQGAAAGRGWWVHAIKQM